jgi:hypothetical protein
MSGRVNPFATLAEAPVFTTKPRKEKPIETEAIDRIAKENNFPSRQAPKPQKETRRKPRRYTTGRNQQLNIKATGETIDRFLKQADARGVPLGEALRLATEALEREGASVASSKI